MEDGRRHEGNEEAKESRHMHEDEEGGEEARATTTDEWRRAEERIQRRMR
jgi:hypothetical protein